MKPVIIIAIAFVLYHFQITRSSLINIIVIIILGMKSIWIVPVLDSILILGTLGLSQQVEVRVQ